MYVCMYACMYVCMYVCVYIYVYIYIYIHLSLSLSIYIYIYTYTHITTKSVRLMCGFYYHFNNLRCQKCTFLACFKHVLMLLFSSELLKRRLSNLSLDHLDHPTKGDVI